MAPILRRASDRSRGCGQPYPRYSGRPARMRRRVRGRSTVSLLLPKELLQMTDPIARTYLSLGAFYASDPDRRGSRERDVGLFWRSRSGPSFRAAWVRDTGELY